MSRLKQKIDEFRTYLDQWEQTTGAECPAPMAAIHLDRIRASLGVSKPESAPVPQKPSLSIDEVLGLVDDVVRMCEGATGIPVHPEHRMMMRMAVRVGMQS